MVKKKGGRASSSKSTLANSTPKFGGDVRHLSKFALKQLMKPLTEALSAVLRYQPKSASVFVSTWLKHLSALNGASLPEDHAVLDSLTVDGDEKRRLRAKLIEPEADEEAVLGTTEAELQEMRAFLDKHLHHLLVQGTKAGMRARSDDMIGFLQRFLESASEQLYDMHTREKELEVVAREKAVRMNMFNEAGTKSQDQIIQEAADDKEPSLTPLMQLRLVLEQVEMYVRSSVVAADQTFRVLGERHKAARKEDKVQRAAARDVPALQECIHLTADGVLGALEAAAAAFKEVTFALRVREGAVSGMGSEEIQKEVTTLTESIKNRVEGLRKTVVLHSESFLKVGDFKLENYLADTRAAIVQRVDDLALSVDLDLDDLHADVQALLKKHHHFMMVGIRNSRVISGDIVAVKQELWRIRKGCITIFNSYEERLRSKLKLAKRVRRPPMFACMSSMHIFLDCTLVAALTSAHIQKSDLDTVKELVQNMTDTSRAMLDSHATIVDKRSSEEDVLDNVQVEKDLLELMKHFIGSMSDFQCHLLKAGNEELQHVRSAEQLGRLRQTRDVQHEDIQSIVDMHIPEIDRRLNDIKDYVKITVKGGGFRKDNLLSNMTKLKSDIEQVQTITEHAMRDFARSCVSDISMNETIEDITVAPGQSQTTIHFHLLAMGRMMPEWHPMFVTESQLIAANRIPRRAKTLANLREERLLKQRELELKLMKKEPKRGRRR